MDSIRRTRKSPVCQSIDSLSVAQAIPERFRACLAKALIVAGLLAAWTAPSANASGIYWSVSHTIGHANLDGTGVDQSFISTVGSLGALAVDDTYVYFAQVAGPYMIGRAKLDGTAVEQSFIPGAVASGIAVDGTFIYWSDYNQHKIGRANLDGTGMNADFITGLYGPFGIAVDGTHIYWANGPGNYWISRANLDGTAMNEMFLSTGPNPLALALDGGFMCWSTVPTGALPDEHSLSCGGTGGGFYTSDVNGPLGIAIDGTYVYWTDRNSRAIARANRDGTGVNKSFITSTLNGNVGIAVIPEPGTGLLVMTGLLGLAYRQRRNGRAA